MTKDRILLTREDGRQVNALAPVIVSASRSTDIPAFYCSWFAHRLKVGYCAWTNPFNRVKCYVSFARTRCIAFWSKDPESLLTFGRQLEDKGIHFFVQYTLNDYERENLEPRVPALARRIDTFKRLVDTYGVGRVIWCYDPLLLSDTLTMEELMERITHIAEQLKGYTDRLVFSFADIERYQKVKANLASRYPTLREFSQQQMEEFARLLSHANQAWGMRLQTCAEAVDLSAYGITHGACIDRRLIAELFADDKELMNHIGYPFADSMFDIVAGKDKGQRALCGCFASKDIGQYNTCPHGCAYCYANTSPGLAIVNYKRHQSNPLAETIVSE